MSTAQQLEHPAKVLVTKIGLDGHDRGSRIVAAFLRDAGMEVIYTPPWQEIGQVVRLALEERASMSPDACTGLEASLRFAGPETMETKIFGRLSAWQNWIFQRPNAAGPEGALKLYGTGQRSQFDPKRV